MITAGARTAAGEDAAMTDPAAVVDVRRLAELGAERKASLAVAERALDDGVAELRRAKAAGAKPNLEDAARQLGVAKTTLYRRLA